MAERLRDLSQPIDVTLLDATVAAFYGTGSKEEVSYPFWFSRSRLPLISSHVFLCLVVLAVLGRGFGDFYHLRSSFGISKAFLSGFLI